MDAIIKITVFLIVFGISGPNAQTLNYQGIARNAEGEPLAQREIAVRLGIKDALISGNTLYTESKSVTTNGFGMYSIAINDGNGTRTGNFGEIDWSQQRFIQTEIDPDNGAAFTDLGTAPLHSVPQALNALQAATLKGIPAPKEGYFIEYRNGEWIQKPKPKKYSAHGVGFNPRSTYQFVGAVCTIEVEEDNPIVTISATKIFGSTLAGGGIGLNLSLAYRDVDAHHDDPPTYLLGPVGLNGQKVPKDTRIPTTLSGSYPTTFKAGKSYVVGMAAFSNSAATWDDNGSGTIFVEVSY